MSYFQEPIDESEGYTPDLDEMADQIAEDAWEIWIARRHAEGCPEVGSLVLLDEELCRVFSLSSAQWSSKYGRMQELHLVELFVWRGEDASRWWEDASRHVLWPTEFESGHARVATI